MDERVLRAEASIELAEKHLQTGQLALAFEAAQEGAVIVSSLQTPAAIRSGVEARLIATEASIYGYDLELAEQLAQRAVSGVEQLQAIRKRIEDDEEELKFVAGRGRLSDVLDPNLELDDHLDSQLAIRCDLVLWKVREACGDDRALHEFQRLAEHCLATSATSPLGLLASRHVLSCAIYNGDSDAGNRAMVTAFEAGRARGSPYLGEWFRWCAAFLISEGLPHKAKGLIESAREIEAMSGSVIGRIENLLVLAHLEYELDHEEVAIELLSEALTKATNLGVHYLVVRPISSYA